MNREKQRTGMVRMPAEDFLRMMAFARLVSLVEDPRDSDVETTGLAAPKTFDPMQSALPLENGTCPKCQNATFYTVARVDSWGTYLDRAPHQNFLCCDKCQQRVQYV